MSGEDGRQSPEQPEGAEGGNREVVGAAREEVAEEAEVEDLGNNLLELGLNDPALRDATVLTLDPNTAHKRLSLHNFNKRVTYHLIDQKPLPHDDRFGSWHQVLCLQGLTGDCYWEVEWTGGGVDIGVTDRGIERKGKNPASLLGRNELSWCLCCKKGSYQAWHNNVLTDIAVLPDDFNRVGVCLGRPAGTLSFCRVSPDGEQTPIHSYAITPIGDLYPGFRFISPSASGTLRLFRVMNRDR